MSNDKENKSNLNIVYSKIDNGLNDEEIMINNNETANDDYNYYINNNNLNNFEGEEDDDEKSDDTIVAFQEEKNSNLFESSENIFIKDLKNEKEESNKTINKFIENNKESLSNLNNNTVVSKNSTALSFKKTKKKKKKKKKDKTEKIEIYAKDKNKLKQVKINNMNKIKLEKNINKKHFKNNDKTDKNTFIKKLSNPTDLLRSKSLSKTTKDMPDKMGVGSIELSSSKIIYENGVSDDEGEMNKIIKKKKKRKKYLKPIMTQYLQNIKEKNEYNLRLQKIRQQFTEKKFVHEQKLFYYVLKPGNGATLVKNSLKHRINWKEAQMNVTSLFNFKWQPSTICIDYKNLSSVESIPQVVNHFEYHNAISNKANMFLNLFEYCESNNLNIWKYVPFTIFISPENENEKYFDTLYDNINNYIINYNDISNNLNMKEKEEKYSNLFKTIIFKTFGRRKDVPKDTWMMGTRTPLQIPDMHYEGKNFWVLKASNLNRGQCIRLIDSKEKFHEIIKDWSLGINLKGKNKGTTDNNMQLRVSDNNNQNKGDEIPQSDTYITEKIIVQKYIEKPLCYYGRKCDMRIWVLLTQQMKVFVYKEGHLKTCSEKFDINNNKDAFIHITNYSFQKHCLNFQKFELGNEVPFHDFQKYLDKEYKDKKINVKEHIMNQVKHIIEITMRSVKEKINPNKRNFCFEIFGYDFMMDVNLNVFLLEINTNPGLEISSPWIKAIVPRMVDDALRLTIDEVFPTKYQFDKNVITEINYEDYSNDLSNKEKIEEKNDEGPKIIKKKKYVNICDQGSGTQDKNDEKYIQENMRLKEVKLQKKINDINQKDNTKNDNNNNYNNLNNDNNTEKIKKNNNDNLMKKKDKQNKEKEFNQKDYKSPFPVPGYESWENLWEFVCELIDQNIQNTQNTQNNYTAGVRGLLEIQKKRQTSLTQNNINYNKRNKNNIIDNINTYKEKIINKNTKEINKNNSINNKNIKRLNKDEQKEKNVNKFLEKNNKEKKKNEDLPKDEKTEDIYHDNGNDNDGKEINNLNENNKEESLSTEMKDVPKNQDIDIEKSEEYEFEKEKDIKNVKDDKIEESKNENNNIEN